MSEGLTQSGASRRFLPFLLAAGVILGGAGALLRSYAARADNDQDEQEAVQAPQRVSTEHGETVIRLDADAQRRSGIELATLHNAGHPQQRRAYGTVLDAQPLAELHARYAEARAALRSAQAKLAASKGAFERARTLYADQENVSAAQLQAAEAAYRVDQAGLGAAQTRQRTLAAMAQQTWGPVLGRAVVAGSPLLERLIERRQVLLQVTLPPGLFIARPAAGAFVQAAGEARVPISLVSPATRTDPRIQGVSFFYRAAAQPGLVPGMSALAYLPSGESVEGAAIPAAATVWVQGRASIYLRTGAQTFERRTIPTAAPAPDGGYIVPGLPEGARVVVQGAQMLLSEEYRAPVQAEGDDD